MNLNNRIESLIESLGMNISGFASFCGTAQSTMSAILSGSNPRTDIISRIVNKLPNLNARWLLTGEGEMWEKLSKPYLQEEKPNFSFEPSPAYKASEPTPQAPDILAGLMAAYQEIITLRTENKLLREQINNLTSKGL